MKPVSKILQNAFVLCFVLIFILPSGAFVFYYQHEKKQLRKQIKRQMEKGLGKDQLVRLSFTERQKKTELRWEHSKEFEFRGVMYDIVYQEQNADSTIYWCWEDRKETRLNRKLEKMARNHMANHPGKKNQTRLINHLLWGMAAHIIEININTPLCSGDLIYKPYQNTYAFNYFKPIDPPPKSMV